jgi:dethiobiotin synthetase
VQRVLFITGTDTGVGKTVLTCLLARRLIERGRCVFAWKPICSGGREDALALQSALGGLPDLDAINPWHFRASLAPLLAARQAGRVVRLPDLVSGAKRLLLQHELVLVEGAGGLLSPLGEGFNARDLIRKLHASPIVVCPNRLGAVNQALLVLAALPPATASRAPVVLVTQPEPDASSAGNAGLLSEQIGPERVHLLPWLAKPGGGAVTARRLNVMLDGLLAALGLPGAV